MTAAAASVELTKLAVLQRLLAGPALTAAERAALRDIVTRPDRVRRRAPRAVRHSAVFLGTLLTLGVLNLACAPQAAAFDIFGPVKRAVKSVLEEFLMFVAHAMCDFVAGLAHGVLGYADKGLAIDFNAAWFKDNYEAMMMGGFLMGLAIFVVQIIAAALRRNPTQMLMSLSATLLGVFCSFVALSLVMMVSNGIDEWCTAVVGHGPSLADSTRDTIKKLPDTVGPVGAMFMALMYLVAVPMLFVILVARRLGIFIIALFIPVYAAGLGGGWTNNMVKRAAELLFVLLFMKLAIVATFKLGADMLIGDTAGLDASVTAMSGVVVMGFAIMSPLGLMYLVAFADGLLIGQMASGAHAGRAGLSRAGSQIRGHNGHGSRSALGRVTGMGRTNVSRNPREGVGTSARNAAGHVNRGSRAAGRGALAVGRTPVSSARTLTASGRAQNARAQGARKVARADRRTARTQRRG